jgi:plastocyanin
MAGPLLLNATNQALQNQGGQNIGIYDIYGRLLLQSHCQISALTVTMNLNGGPVQQLAAAYQWERDTLKKVANDNASNTQLANALNWAASQPDSVQVDAWFSAAILTNPITPPNQPAPSTPPPSSPPGTPSPNVVKIQIVTTNGQTTFSPSTVTVSKFTQIIWVNTTGANHEIISNTTGVFSSSSFGQNQTFTITLSSSGTFVYHCGIHNSMQGTIIVKS